MPADNGSRTRTGSLSVSLATPDGRVIGGGIGGVLIAATPIQVKFLIALAFHHLAFHHIPSPQ